MTISIWHLAPGSWQHGAGNYFCKYVREGGIDMHDVALCHNRGCPSKETCYRFTAELPDSLYARFDSQGAKKCDYYIPTRIDSTRPEAEAKDRGKP